MCYNAALSDSVRGKRLEAGCPVLKFLYNALPAVTFVTAERHCPRCSSNFQNTCVCLLKTLQTLCSNVQRVIFVILYRSYNIIIY